MQRRLQWTIVTVDVLSCSKAFELDSSRDMISAITSVRSTAFTLAFTNLMFNGLVPIDDVVSVSKCSMHCLQDMGCLAIFYNNMEKKCYLSPKQYQSGSAGLSLKQGTMVYHRHPDFCPILYGYQWSSDGSTCYRYGDHLTWNEASAACQEHGGRLMQVETAHKNSVIVEIIEDNNAGGMLFVFFGMVDYESEGTPRWADGSQISGYENWAPGSQDSAQEECGIYHRKNPSKELQWEDQYCSANYDYICEVVLD